MKTYITPQCEMIVFAAEENFLASAKARQLNQADAIVYDEDFWE